MKDEDNKKLVFVSFEKGIEVKNTKVDSRFRGNDIMES